MPFSQRRVLSKQIEIFNATGQLIILWVRNTLPSPESYTPGHLFTQNEDPLENTTDYTKRYIRGKFEESDFEQSDGPGRRRYVWGIITVPMLYSTILAATEYIDPYCNGSRFIKDGASSPDQERVFITQNIKLLSATSPSEIT